MTTVISRFLLVLLLFIDTIPTFGLAMYHQPSHDFSPSQWYDRRFVNTSELRTDFLYLDGLIGRDVCDPSYPTECPGMPIHLLGLIQFHPLSAKSLTSRSTKMVVIRA